jgi:hypothetical protein
MAISFAPHRACATRGLHHRPWAFALRPSRGHGWRLPAWSLQIISQAIHNVSIF